MLPFTKFIFKLIYIGNIFHAFRKSFHFSETQKLKANEEPDWRVRFRFMRETFACFWKFTRLNHLVEIEDE